MATTIARPTHENASTGAADGAALPLPPPRTAREISHPTEIPGPPLARWLFKDARAGWLWLPLRLYLGWAWLQHGLEKVTNPAWTESGQALAGFWGNAVTTDPKPVIAVPWYRAFIETMLGAQAYTWFADLVVYGEILVGVALILGAFTGIAAFFGAFMNWNYIMAGSASTNGLLLVIAVGLMVGWKVTGWVGLDRWLLPLLGTPWHPGTLFRPRDEGYERPIRLRSRRSRTDRAPII
jgi:thiosulfate dehydrogenase (quinone) large subunit